MPSGYNYFPNVQVVVLDLGRAAEALTRVVGGHTRGKLVLWAG
jgi:hypothetical protein